MAEMQELSPEIRNARSSILSWTHAYGGRGVALLGAHHEGNRVTYNYNPLHLSAVRVLCTWVSSSLTVRVLLLEQAIVLVIYVLTLLGFLNLPTAHQLLVDEGNQVELLESFVGVMTSLSVFLLGLYTSTSIARWWRLRTEGVGAVWSACSQLSLLVSQHVTRDERTLSALRRYSCASLMLIFMRHRELSDDLDQLIQTGILDEEEVECLKSWNSNLSESIWTWHTAILMRLHKKGVMNDRALWRLLDVVRLGRAGVATINAQLATPLPYHYVHILGVMVKLHNIVLAFTVGARAADLILSEKQASESGFFIAFGFVKIFFPPFLYNAVLLINALLANPFAKHDLAFPKEQWLTAMQTDALSYVDAGAHCPAWIMRDNDSDELGSR